MQSAWRLLSRKYSPIVTPAYGRDVLEGRRIGRRGRDHGRVRHGAAVLEHPHDLRHGRALLADRDVEAVDALALLVEDRVDRDRRLPGLAVADDQLPLAAPDGDHRVDRLDPGLERLLHGAPVDHAGRVALDRPELLGVDRALAVDRLAEGVDHAAHQGLAHRHLRDAARALHDVALADRAVLAEEHRADVVLLEVQHHADDVLREREQLPGHRPLEPVHAGDPVAHLDHPPDLGEIGLALELLDLASDDLADLAGLDHAAPPAPLVMRSLRAASWPAMLMSRTRLPTSATNPPRRLGSTSVSKRTVLPSRRPRRSRSAARSASRQRARRCAPAPGLARPPRRRAPGRRRGSPRGCRAAGAARRAPGSSA